MTEWLRNCTVHLLLDLLCWAVPQGQRFELIIEPEDENTMVAVLRELPRNHE